MRTILRFVSLILLFPLFAPSADARSLRDVLAHSTEAIGVPGGPPFDALADSIADAAARNIPILSASAGYTYRYNPDIHAFELASDTLGPLLLERPDTLGRGKLNLSASFEYVDINEYDGAALDRIEAPNPVVLPDGKGGYAAFRVRYDASLTSYVGALSATYGLLDDLDLNLLVPVISNTLDLGVRAGLVGAAGPDQVFSPASGVHVAGATDGSSTGIGDILLRLKYQLPHWNDLRSAAGLQLRMPSGNKDDFQGVGAFEMSPFLYLSRTYWSQVELYGNAGVDVRPEDVEQSQARYGVGVDVNVLPRLGLSLAFLGRNEFSGVAKPGETDFPHLTSAGIREQPLLGLDLGRKDFYDLTFGVRLVDGGNVIVYAYGIRALNDDGWRNDTIVPGIGVEVTF